MNLRILFVERDMTISDLLVPSLERKGYQVSVARTQRQATSRIRTARPDLLVVDIASFGAKGPEIGARLRARLDGVPTVLLAEEGYSDAGPAAEAIMTPPFTSRKLLHRVKKLSTRLTNREASEIRVGPLILDLDARVVHKGDESHHLRPKETSLLALFMHNHGKVLSRQEIIKQVWETDYVGDTRTLSVHVRWLRQKIEPDPNHPRFLRTLRGVGYRFEIPGELPEP
jgi:DNA-binding response OmpR family regulator